MQIVASLNQLSRSKESCSQKVSMIPDSLLQIDNLDSQPYSDLDQKNTEIQSCIQQIGVLEQILDSEFKAKKDLMDQLEQFLETTKKEIVENQLIQEQLRDKKKELTNAFERFSSKLLAPQVSATTGVHKATLDRLFK
jgi:chromosome segregation ATPase